MNLFPIMYLERAFLSCILNVIDANYLAMLSDNDIAILFLHCDLGFPWESNILGHFTLAQLGARLGFQAEPEPSHYM